MTDKKLWICPICGNKAYEDCGKYPVAAIQISNDNRIPTIMHKTFFKCKGCSVFFGNPNSFNHVKLNNGV